MDTINNDIKNNIKSNNNTNNTTNNTSSASAAASITDYSYRTSQSTFFGFKNPINKKLTPYEKNMSIQNIIDNGVLPDSSDIYLPKKSTRDLPPPNHRIIVTKDNFNDVLRILDNYKSKHPNFGMGFDFEIWQSYNIPTYIIDYFKNKFHIKLKKPIYDEKTMKYNRLQYDEEMRTYQNEVLKAILSNKVANQQININDYVLKDPNYNIEEKDLVIFYTNANYLNLVGFLYDFVMPADTTKTITTLLQSQINLLDDNWFHLWLNQTNEHNITNMQALITKIRQVMVQENCLNLGTFLINTLNVDQKLFLNPQFNQNPTSLNYFSTQWNQDANNFDPGFLAAFTNYIQTNNLIKDDLSLVEWSIEKRRFNNFIDKWNALSIKTNQYEPLDKYNKIDTTTYIIDDHNERVLNPNHNIIKSILDHMFQEQQQFINWVKPGKAEYFYPFFMCTFGIEDYQFTFIENQVVNNSNTNTYLAACNAYANQCDSGNLLRYFFLLCIANGVFFYGVNSGDYDMGLLKSWLLLLDPYRFSSLYFSNTPQTLSTGGRVDVSWSYLNRDIDSYYRNQEHLNDFFPWVHLYNNRPYENPLIGGHQIRHIDCLKESLGGATDENLGKGLKEVEANHKSSVEENKGIDFKAVLPSEVTNEAMYNTILYNNYDVFNTTITYANVYKAKQQLAKNAAINLGGQGADLFDIKDRTVGMLLNFDNNENYNDEILKNAFAESKIRIDILNNADFDYQTKDTNPLYLTYLKPFEDTLINGTFTLDDLKPLGITYYLKDVDPNNKLDEKKKNQNKALNFKIALIGVVYRVHYWAKQQNLNNTLDIYPEFTNLNSSHRYLKDFASFKYDQRWNKNIWLSAEQKELKMKEEIKNDPISIIMNEHNVPIRITLRNSMLNSLIRQIANNGGQTTRDIQSKIKTIFNLYNAFQKSDIAILEEQTKLRQTAVYESTSNGQLVQVAAVNGIYLSDFNPLWRPEFQLNYVDIEHLSKAKKALYLQSNDLNHPLYKRVKYVYVSDTKDQAHLKDISNLKEEDKPERDPNQDDFLAYYFDTIVNFDENDPDDTAYKNVINFFNSHMIYHTKPWKLMERERINAANYFNRSGKNYTSWSRIWYNVALNEGITLIKNDQAYNIAFTDFKNPANWHVEVKSEFLGDVLNQQYYPALVFSYEGQTWELNGLSLKWSIKDGSDENNLTLNDLIAPTGIISIEPFEVKYFKHSSDNYNANLRVRFELGLKITDSNNNTYTIRLDNIQPTQLNKQSKTFYGIENKYHDSYLYAIDKDTNLDYDNTRHKWNYKKGQNPIFMQAVKNWFTTHPENPLQSTSNTILNNSFYVYFNNTNNNSIKNLTPSQTKLLKTSNLVNVLAGGLHSCTIVAFDETEGVFAIDPDQTSFYPWILMSFVKAIDTFNAPWYLMSYDLNVLLKKLGEKNKREGSKKNVNSISGKIGELMSILASVANSTNLLRTGQLENLQMHELLRKFMEAGGHPLTLINGNTDGNLYLTTKEGCIYLQHLLDLLFMPRFSKHAISEAMKEFPEFTKIFNLDKWDEWRKANAPFYMMLKNTIEIGGTFCRYLQTSVNRYMGILTNFDAQEYDRKANPDLYKMYEKYCDFNLLDDGNQVRLKVVQFYEEHFANLPADFDLKVISKMVKVKGGWQCWPIIMDLEEAKKQGKENDIITDQYNKFGRGPILDFATVSRMLFNQDLKTALTRFNDPLYFCFNSKRTSKYNGSYFQSINGQKRIELEKVTRYIIAKTKNPDLVGNISKYKTYKKESFDVDDMLDFYADNKAVYKAQIRIQTFAINLNNMCTAMNQKEVCKLTKVGLVRGSGEVFRISFDFDRFKTVLDTWNDLRKGLKYQKANSNTLVAIPTKDKLMQDLYALGGYEVSKPLEVLKDLFSSNLNYHEDTKLYDITISKDSESKVTGSMVCDNKCDQEGFYRGNFIMNNSLWDYTMDTKTGQLYQNNVPLDVYVDLDFYYHAALYACWNMQKYFLAAKKNMNNYWRLKPQELYDLITQNDINPSLGSYKKEIGEYLAKNGFNISNLPKQYHIDDNFTLDAEEQDLADALEEGILVDENANDAQEVNEDEIEAVIKKAKAKTKTTKKKVANEFKIDQEQVDEMRSIMQSIFSQNKNTDTDNKDQTDKKKVNKR